ncbi:MAG: DUF4416 family protein [Candidatus Omnitrophica bacterium]|nr:DUF4416 family protein [Candidatus Omnitrophota bacterium]
MSEAIKPSPVKLVIGAIFPGEGILIEAKVRLEKKFGPLDFQSPLMPFNYTEYYEKEMGPNLLRQFLSFQRLISPRKLAAIKLYTNRLEKGLSRARNRPKRASDPSAALRVNGERSRTINLDPGYICAAKLVLATCKDYAHRIYLGKGVFAEVTLHFQQGTFRPRPWTFPDYRSKGYIQSFNTVREIYLKQLCKGSIYRTQQRRVG